MSKPTESWMEYIIVNYRWVFVMFLLPASAAYDLWFYTRSAIVFWMNSAPGKHAEKVAEIQRQIRQRSDEGDTRPMCTARPGMQLQINFSNFKYSLLKISQTLGWQTISPQNMSYKSKMRQINVNLVDILEVDTKNE